MPGPFCDARAFDLHNGLVVESFKSDSADALVVGNEAHVLDVFAELFAAIKLTAHTELRRFVAVPVDDLEGAHSFGGRVVDCLWQPPFNIFEGLDRVAEL